MESNSKNLLELFREVPDPRFNRGKRHLLEEILTITTLAVICGADDWKAIEDYAHDELDFLSTFLELPFGIPSDDTFRRVFSRLDSDSFSKSFIQWSSNLAEILVGDVISLDGKTARRSFANSTPKSAIHLVSAWSNANHMVLGQLKVESKSNEITAIPKLLEQLCIAGNIVTIDAMGCQTDIAEQIVDHSADYILAVKDNQLELKEQMEPLFNILPPDSEDEQVEGDHGRIEIRKAKVINDLKFLDERYRWKGIKSIVLIESTREIKGKQTKEERLYISSLNAPAKVFNQAVRMHWGIENSLHWVLDIAFREDDCRKRIGNQAENFALIRKFALNLLKKDKSVKLGIKNKRLKAGRNKGYLLKLFLN